MNQLLRLATVDSVVAGGVKLIFAGESAAREKTYACVSCSPVVGDRVCIAPVSGTYIVLGVIGGAGGSSSGDVVGPESAIDERIVVFNGTTGKLIKDSGISLLTVQTLSASKLVYVTPGSGSISGDGTSGDPWTGDNVIAYAISQAPKIIPYGCIYTIQLAAGTYTEKNILIDGFLGGGDIRILGDGSAPSSYIIQGSMDSSTDYVIAANGCIARPFIQGVKVFNTGTKQGWGIRGYKCLNVTVYQCDIDNFGNTGMRGAVDIDNCLNALVYATDFGNNALAIRAVGGSAVTSQSNTGAPTQSIYAAYLARVVRLYDSMTGATGTSIGGSII